MPRFMLPGLIIGLLLTPLMSAAEGAEPFEVPPEQREVVAPPETEAKLDEPREIRPEELEGFDQISVGSPRSNARRKADMERKLRTRLVAALNNAAELDHQGELEKAEELRHQASELLKKAEQESLAIGSGHTLDLQEQTLILNYLLDLQKRRQKEGATSEKLEWLKDQIWYAQGQRFAIMESLGISGIEEWRSHIQKQVAKHEKPLPQFKAETERLKHLRAAAEHLQAADMHELADSLTRQADTLAQYIEQAREILEIALKAEAEKKAPTLEISPSEIKAHREAQGKKLIEQLRESIRLQQEAK